MKKAIWIILFFAFCLNSCGKKGSLKEPENRVRFENIVDEND